MKKRTIIKRTITGTLLTGLVGVAGIIILILNPQSLFAHELEHGKFTVYANFPIDKNIKGILDNAILVVESCEIYDPNYEYKIFFAYQTFYNKIDNLLFDPYAAARPTDNNIIVKARADIEKGLAYTDHSEIDLIYLFAHEMIHCFQHNKYGLHKFNPFNHPPMWKVEGYPEYVARQEQLQAADYDLATEIRKFVSLEKSDDYERVQVSEKHFIPKLYFKSRIMVEYLMDVKGLTYDDVLEENIEEEAVIPEMINWSKKN